MIPDIDEDTRSRYRHGACRALAIALHDATSWPLVVVSDFDADDDLTDDDRVSGQIAPARMSPAALHALVLCPNGSLIDIDGEHDPADLVDAYATEADEGMAVLRFAERADLLEEHEGTSAAASTVEEAAPHARAVVAHLRETSDGDRR